MKKVFIIVVVGIILTSSVALADFVDIFNTLRDAILPPWSITGYQTAAPDLIINTYDSSGTLVAGNSIRFTAVVKNIGTASTETATVVNGNSGGVGYEIDVIDGQQDLGVPPTGTIAAGGTLNTTSSAWTATAGTHTVKICADWWNFVAESNENNNCKYYYFSVSPATTTTTTTLPPSCTSLDQGQCQVTAGCHWCGSDQSCKPSSQSCPSCTSLCSGWTNLACASPSCVVSTQRLQSRTCPAGSTCFIYQCISDPACTTTSSSTTTTTTLPPSCNTLDQGQCQTTTGCQWCGSDATCKPSTQNCPLCTSLCSGWSNLSCGSSSCVSASQRLQSRTCPTTSNCNRYQCVSDPACTTTSSSTTTTTTIVSSGEMIKVRMFYDKNSNGIPEAGENFSIGGNPSFSSSIATVNEKRVNLQDTDITSLLAPDGNEDRVVNSNNIFYYTVAPSAGWTRTFIAIQDYGLNPGPCILNGPYYICPFNVLGETPVLDLAPNQQIFLYLGVNTLQASTTTTTIGSSTTTIPGQTTTTSTTTTLTTTEPDFIVLPVINVNPFPITAGTNANFTAFIQNIGYPANYNSTTRFRIDINNDGSWNVLNEISASFISSAISISSWDTWTAVAGTHKIEVCADANNNIAENNENNNCRNETFTVNQGYISGNQTNATQQWYWLANANSNYSGTIFSWSGIASVPSAATKIAIAVWEGEEERTLNGNEGNYDITFINNSCARSNSPWGSDAEGECIVISDLNNDFTYDNTYPSSQISECDIRYIASTRLLEFRDISTSSDCGYSIHVLGNISSSSTSVNFVGSDFICEKIQNRQSCTIDYTTNTTGLYVLFALFDSNGIVRDVENAVTTGTSGIASANLFCDQTNKNFSAEWIVYTDSSLTTPVKWVRSNEIRQIAC